MAHKNQGNVLVITLPEQKVKELRLPVRIERRGRLVGYDEFGVPYQGASGRYALLLSHRKRRGGLARQLRIQAQQLEQSIRGSFERVSRIGACVGICGIKRLLPPAPGKPAGQQHVLAHG